MTEGANCCNLSNKMKFWSQNVWYFIMICIYISDIGTDLYLGVTRIKDRDVDIVSVLILLFVFLPAVGTFVLAYVGKKFYIDRRGRIYEETLVEFDWLDEEKEYRIFARTTIFILLRIHTIYIYGKLIHRTIKLRDNDDEKIKKLEKRIDAETFLEALFESLPQMCLQLYLFGTKDGASTVEIISISMSMLSLVFSFSFSNINKERRIYKDSKHSTRKKSNGIRMEPVSRESENKRRNAVVRLSSPSSSFNYYYQSYLRMKNSLENEKYFFWNKCFHVGFESFLFLLTAFPTISLFCSLFGASFSLLFIPVLIHLTTEYWWWRPKVYKRGMTRSFHAIFLAFKLLERLVIFVMICTWFIKVMELSKPLEPPNKQALPSIVWPTPNRFLATVARYEIDEGARRNMSARCISIRQSISFAQDSICAIDVSSYLFCFLFYINIIGVIWEVFHFIFWMLWKSKQGKEKEAEGTGAVGGTGATAGTRGAGGTGIEGGTEAEESTGAAGDVGGEVQARIETYPLIVSLNG